MTTDPEPRTQRSATQPMAFTSDELLRGGCATWVIFMILLIGASAISAIGSAIDASQTNLSPGNDLASSVSLALVLPLIVGIFGGIIAAIVMVFGVLLARPIGYAMRRVRSIPLHLLVYSGLGLLVAALYLTVISGGHPLAVLTYGISSGTIFVLFPGIAAAVAVPLGWWWTARRALREDAGLWIPRRRRRADLGAANNHQTTG